MSIFPATDIISDVARAAEPHKRDVAMKRLNDIASSNRTNTSAFTAMVDARRRTAPTCEIIRPAVVDGGLAGRPQPLKSPATVAAQKFEAYILQTWLEVLLPKVEGGSFGAGAGGDVWRSMMAERLGAQLASAGGVGIQKMLDGSDDSAASLRPLAPPPAASRASLAVKGSGLGVLRG